MTRSAILLAVLALGPGAFAQVPIPGPPPRFEVVSVKPSDPAGGNMTVSVVNPAQFSARNATLAGLAALAYELRDVEQVIGGPDWIRSARFDITARAEGAPLISQVSAMMRAMLADRFALQVHIDTRDGPIYALRIVRGDGTLGPSLRATGVDCAALSAAGQLQQVETGQALCTGRQSLSGRRRILRTRALPMAQLATMLGVAVGRDVIDRTDLPGGFDAELEWTLDGPPDLPRMPVADDGVSVFTAVREQLGLKLEPERGPVRSLVIDAVERPSPD